MKVNVGHASVMLGMQWSIALDRKEVAALKKAHSREGYVSVSVGQMWCLGFHADLAIKRAYSGALLLGQAYPNCIVCLPISSGLFWFCVIQESRPLVGLDLLLSERQAHQHLLQYQQTFSNYMVLRAKTPVSQGVACSDLEELLSHQVQQMDAKSGFAFALQSPRLRAQRLRKIALLSVVLGLLGVFSHEWLDQQHHLDLQSQKRAERTLLSTRLDQEAQVFKAKQEKEAKALEVQLLKRAKPFVFITDAEQLWFSFNALRRSIPLSRHGMSVKAIQCSENNCEVHWILRGPWSGIHSGAQEPMNAQWSSLNAQGESSSTVALQVGKVAYSNVVIQTPKELELYMSLRFKKIWPTLSMSPIRVLKLERTAPMPREVILGASREALPESSLTQPIGSFTPEVHLGDWQISWSGDAALLRAGEFISGLKGTPLALESLVYTLGSGLQLKGTFYVMYPKHSIWQLAKEVGLDASSLEGTP